MISIFNQDKKNTQPFTHTHTHLEQFSTGVYRPRDRSGDHLRLDG